ncbi:MAG: hypothetical protein EOO47_02225 [Flavobacterium sp.]|nr:MAG: hypothetical protein EOO47_02225 [Flavobacterium sp.]
MKSLLLILFFNIFSCAHQQQQTEVYLCDSSNGKKYHHKQNCRGLSNCSYKTIKVSLEKAKKMGKTFCGWEK